MSDQASLFYEFRLDDRVPKDHLLKRIDVFRDDGSWGCARATGAILQRDRPAIRGPRRRFIPQAEKSHMRNATTLSIAMLAAAIGFTLVPALRAQEAPGSAAPQTPGMSDHGRMMNNDMRRMMMDECSRMMQSINEHRSSPSPDRPQETPSPPR
jgi:hypothetical protein